MELQAIHKVSGGRYLIRYDLEYTLQNGQAKRYEMVSRTPVTGPADLDGGAADGVVMVILNADGTRLLLNREFRPAVGKVLYNFPAGMTEPGETTAQAVRRELWEETGLSLTEMVADCGLSYGAVGISNESSSVCLGRADDTAPFSAHHEAAEEIEPVWVSKEQAGQILRGGQVTARVQMFLLLWAEPGLLGPRPPQGHAAR